MTTSEHVDEIQDGAAVEEMDGAAVEGGAIEFAAPHLAAVQDMYEEAKARIVSFAGSSSDAEPSTDPADTRRIDMSAVPPPTALRPHEPEAQVPDLRTDASAGASRRRRHWSTIRNRIRATG